MINDIRQSIVEALAQMNYDINDVDGGTVLGPAGLDLESLAVAELAVRVEDAYGVKFSDAELEGLATLNLDEFSAEVAARVASQPAAAE